MAHISSKGAYEDKSWKRGSTFFTLKYDLSIWYKSVTQRLRTLLVSLEQDSGIKERTDQFEKIASILKPFNFRVLPLVKKSFNYIIKLGKDVTDKWDRTNVVYKFTCKSCPASYVRETKRALRTRINEHKKNNNPEAVVYQHTKNFSHGFDWNNVKIIDCESNYKKRIISEMIHIKCNKHNVNKKKM